MSNHLHLALQAGEAPLSVGMQNLSFRYTRHLNTRLDRSGHVFQGRFKAYVVDQDRYGLELVRYIHLNPVRARMVKQAGSDVQPRGLAGVAGESGIGGFQLRPFAVIARGEAQCGLVTGR